MDIDLGKECPYEEAMDIINKRIEEINMNNETKIQPVVIKVSNNATAEEIVTELFKRIWMHVWTTAVVLIAGVFLLEFVLEPLLKYFFF